MKTDHKLILQHYFSNRPIARTKELKNNMIHVAFADGTMAVYSSKEVEQFAETMLLSTHYELSDNKRLQMENPDDIRQECYLIH